MPEKAWGRKQVIMQDINKEKQDKKTGNGRENKPEIKMIALDLDNTTLRSDKTLSPITKKSIEKAIEKGVKAVISTGRVFSSLPVELLAVKGLEYVINSNGAVIRRLSDGEVIRARYLGRERAEAIADIVKKSGLPIESFSDGKAYTDAGVYNDLKEHGSPVRSADYVLKTRTPVDNIWEHIDETADRIENISITVADRDMKSELIRKLSLIDGVTITSSVPFNIEVEGPDTSKASALRFLLELTGIKREELMACGDSPNDMKMIEFAGLGVAVANAEPEVREVADYVTDSNDNDGVAKAIEKFVLL